MTSKAEFERLLDVYGFRCERFGQDLSTHARAQVVSAFAALASAPVAGEAVAWRVTHPSFPKPRWQDAAREPIPCQDEVKQQDPALVLELAYAAPQASEAVRNEDVVRMVYRLRAAVQRDAQASSTVATHQESAQAEGDLIAAIRAMTPQADKVCGKESPQSSWEADWAEFIAWHKRHFGAFLPDEPLANARRIGWHAGAERTEARLKEQ